MTDEEIAVRLEDHSHEIGSLKHRMDAAEESNRILNRLTTAVEVMVAKQDAISHSVERLTSKVDALEMKPAKRWDTMAEKVLLILVGAFSSWLFSGLFGV